MHRHLPPEPAPDRRRNSSGEEIVQSLGQSSSPEHVRPRLLEVELDDSAVPLTRLVQPCLLERDTPAGSRREVNAQILGNAHCLDGHPLLKGSDPGNLRNNRRTANDQAL